jgi:hypothetical protein
MAGKLANDIYTALRLIAGQCIDIDHEEHQALDRLATSAGFATSSVAGQLDELLEAHVEMIDAAKARHREYDENPWVATAAQTVEVSRVDWARHARGELRANVTAGERVSAERLML